MNIRNGFGDLQQILTGNSTGKVASTGQPEKTAAGARPASLEGDQAHVSLAANLATEAAGLPEVRAEKVAAIQAALADGSYRVEPEKVAAKLISHLLGE